MFSVTRPRAVSTAYSSASNSEKPHDSSSRTPRRMRRYCRCPPLIAFLSLAFLVASGLFLSRRLNHEVHQFRQIKQHYSGPEGKHVVIASFKEQNVDWLQDVPSSWTPYRYFLDDPNPPNNLSVPNNLGREAMAYLTYIIDHYDNIPEYVIFTHGHYRSWHQVEPLDWKIRALNLTALDREGYISLRCEDFMGCEVQPYLDVHNVNWDGERTIPEFWEATLPGLPMPRYLSYKCCAQFAVTRNAIKQHSKETWERLRSPLLMDLDVLRTEEKWAAGPPEVNDWTIGIFYEKVWQAVFTGRGEVCPPVAQCRQEFFSNAILCAGDMDLSVWNSHWSDVHCISAFEGVAPNDEPDWAAWYNPSQFYRNTERVSRLRSDAYNEPFKKVDTAAEEIKRAQGIVDRQQKVLDHRDKKIRELEAKVKTLEKKQWS